MSELLADEPVEPEILSSERVFTGMVWGVRAETFRYGDGQLRREFLDHTGAVAVLALDEQDRVALIKQYRHPVRSREWEIPAGLLDIEGEDPLRAAQRELGEEIDLRASRWDLLAEFASSPGGSDEMIRVYLARGLFATDSAFDREAEEADMQVRWVALDDVVEAVLARRLRNPSLTIAALAASAFRARDWVGLGDASSPWLSHPRGRHPRR
ncbi:NUDIX domain-containing protein [Rathayibacter toxicus]|uniref:NUDIX hydrolase n=1 Tax=Rathayibacter toxicus TaxID=145458 RepID=A0A2S5Y6G8_9MICO|nr:NUDIX hydrolase [Rathayibacter toxicus]PPH23539.1 NUDIX hydrolase [Rathayibacter toxicus]PPH57344.1 NUDIX hydrolase [Rathayibacter toxicus]PPH59844.1 NUDIX hydrolase [Rathayibacter toxicus]PPH87300.1 NUDIX hydrolase [Rathayibacter toxicus]PPI15070.1 NUDIX hydrolase [Rathayibacter toxicus]